MLLPSPLDKIFTKQSTIFHVFLEESLKEGQTKEYAKELVKLLPKSIKESDVWFDNMVGVWRYFYGDPITLSKTTVIGSNTFIEVTRLYKAITIAYKYLPFSQFCEYVKNLEQIGKHEDFLFEMRPLVNINRKAKNIKYEAKGNGEKRIDWKVEYSIFSMLFDVKHRVKSFIDHMETIASTESNDATKVPIPDTDPSVLFRSLEEKMVNSLGIIKMQGVWIQTEIQEEYCKLVDYFTKSLNHKKIHFCIISNWTNEAFIITRYKFQKYIIKKVFNLMYSERFVFRREET